MLLLLISIFSFTDCHSLLETSRLRDNHHHQRFNQNFTYAEKKRKASYQQHLSTSSLPPDTLIDRFIHIQLILIWTLKADMNPH